MTGVQTCALPISPPNLQVIPAGSLIIPMDNTYQTNGSLFNLKAYGLVNSLLHNLIPVKWAIASGKSKDGVDFSASVQRVLPTAGPTTNISFKAGPFIVHRAFTNWATPVMSAFGNKVVVYRLMSDTPIDIRYDLTFRPRIMVLNDDGTAHIHTDLLTSAGFNSTILGAETGLPSTNFVTVPIVDTNLTASACYSLVSSPHFGGGGNENAKTLAIRNFIENGGNFLAQCAAAFTYENNLNQGLFQTTTGIIDTGGPNLALSYPFPDLAFSQFQGDMSDEGGSLQSWQAANSFVFQRATHMQVQYTGSVKMKASMAKLTPGSMGSAIFYLGGHEYKSANNEDLNGRRMYLNAVFTPPKRLGNCAIACAQARRRLSGVNSGSSTGSAITTRSGVPKNARTQAARTSCATGTVSRMPVGRPGMPKRRAISVASSAAPSTVRSVWQSVGSSTDSITDMWAGQTSERTSVPMRPRRASMR